MSLDLNFLVRCDIVAPTEGSLRQNIPIDAEKLQPRKGSSTHVSQVQPSPVPTLIRQGKGDRDILMRPSTVVTPGFEGKPNANHVRARIINSHTQQLHK
jgi:hypothetical protein